jgi:hypothetical protein
MQNESLSGLFGRGITRRNLVRRTVSAGAVLGSGIWTAAGADDDKQDERSLCGQPLPITHTQPNPFGVQIHTYFAGPIDGSASPLTDPLGIHPEGRDPSTITNFSGVVGQVDLVFSGTGTDTKTGAKAMYSFHTDTRFMQGQFIGADEQRHHGTFAFI